MNNDIDQEVISSRLNIQRSIEKYEESLTLAISHYANRVKEQYPKKILKLLIIFFLLGMRAMIGIINFKEGIYFYFLMEV